MKTQEEFAVKLSESCRKELDRARQALSAGNLADAEELLARLIEEQPQWLEPKIVHTRLLERKGLLSQALDSVERLAERFPPSLPLQLRRIEILTETGDFERAFGLMEGLLALHVPSPALLGVKYRLERAAERYEDAFRSFQDWAKALPAQESHWLQAIQFFARKGRGQEAVGLFRAALQALDSKENISRQVARLAVSIEDPETIDAMLGLLEDRLSLWVRARKRLDEMDSDEAFALLSEALKAYPEDYELVLLQARVAKVAGKGPVSRHVAEWLVDHPEATPEGQMLGMELLLASGAADAFKQRGARLCEDPKLSSAEKRQIERSLGVLSTSPAAAHLMPEDSDIGIFIPEGARQVVFVFAGLAQEAGLPLDLLHPFFARLPVGVVYLRDFERLLFLKGVKSLGGDYSTTLDRLKGLLPPQVEEIYCFGNSAGGYAALRYALDLGAKAALLVAAPTSLDAAACQQDGRAKAIARKIHRSVPEMARDLSSELKASAAPLKVDVWYGDKMPQDSEHASRLAGIDSVTLHPIDHAGHDVLWRLAETGALDGAIRGCFGLGGEAGLPGRV